MWQRVGQSLCEPRGRHGERLRAKFLPTDELRRQFFRRGKVEEDEVDKQLEEIRNGQAAERSVERPLETGDVLIADLQRLDDARLPIVGEKFEARQVLIGAADAPRPPHVGAGGRARLLRCGPRSGCQRAQSGGACFRTL